jgi:hypothetical protein
MPPVSYCILPGRFAVCRLEPDDPLPGWAPWADHPQLLSLTRSPDELSIVIDETQVPDGVKAERGLRALKVIGPLPFDMVGLLARLASALADSGIPIFVISTFETDFILVPEQRLQQATETLQRSQAARQAACPETSTPGLKPSRRRRR